MEMEILYKCVFTQEVDLEFDLKAVCFEKNVSVRLFQAVDRLKAGALAVEAVAAALVELEVGCVLFKPELNIIEENLDTD